MSRPDGLSYLPDGAEVVLDVPRTLHRARVDVALELFEDLVVALADDVGEHVQPAAMGHADDHLVETAVGGGREDRVEDRDRRLGALEPEALRAHVLRGEELLERLGRVEPFEQAAELVGREAHLHALELRLDPPLLVGVLDVHVLDADRPAVRVTQDVEQVAELHLLGAGDAAGAEHAVEIPDRQAVGRRIELGVHLRFFPAQRVEIGDEVAADAVRADQRRDVHLLLEHRLLTVEGRDVGVPANRLVRHVEIPEDPLIEVVVAEQQLVDALQEESGLRALDDAVVVGARDGDDLGHAELGEGGAVGALELCRVVDRPDTDDDPLAGHQAGHGLDGSDRARIRQRDGGALEVGHLELVRLHLADEVLVRGQELRERHRVGLSDDRHDQRAAAVGLRHVDGEAEVHVRVAHDARLAVGALDVRVVHRRHGVGDGADDRVPDEVGEADLPLARAGVVAVDDRAVDLEQARRHVAEARRRRYMEAALHVGDDGGAGTTDRFAELGLGHRWRRDGGHGGGCRRGGSSRRHGSGGRRRAVPGVLGAGIAGAGADGALMGDAAFDGAAATVADAGIDGVIGR